MTRTILILSLLLAATATAQPTPRSKPATTVGTTTSYEGCTKSWAFACNKPDGRGGRYGTAHEMTHCERYTLQPDGTFTTRRQVGGSAGTYTIVKNTVTFTSPNQDGTTHRFELVLAPDGSTLGTMKRL